MVEDEYRVITLCSMCYNTLKQASLFIKDGEKLDKINVFMDREEEYKGDVEPVPYRFWTRFSLNGLKVAAYYGCLILRLREIGIDDPENSTILDGF